MKKFDEFSAKFLAEEDTSGLKVGDSVKVNQKKFKVQWCQSHHKSGDIDDKSWKCPKCEERRKNTKDQPYPYKPDAPTIKDIMHPNQKKIVSHILSNTKTPQIVEIRPQYGDAKISETKHDIMGGVYVPLASLTKVTRNESEEIELESLDEEEVLSEGFANVFTKDGHYWKQTDFINEVRSKLNLLKQQTLDATLKAWADGKKNAAEISQAKQPIDDMIDFIADVDGMAKKDPKNADYLNKMKEAVKQELVSQLASTHL